MADVEPLYCAEQIKVPDELSEVLKQFTKAAIRQQPKTRAELLEWSAKWFAQQAEEAGETIAK